MAEDVSTKPIEIDPESLSVVQRKALEQLGLLDKEKEDEPKTDWHYKALIRTGVFDGRLNRYIEAVELVETDNLGLSQLGDLVFRKEDNTPEHGSDLIVPRTSVLWLGREWKLSTDASKPQDVESVGQYL